MSAIATADGCQPPLLLARAARPPITLTRSRSSAAAPPTTRLMLHPHARASVVAGREHASVATPSSRVATIAADLLPHLIRGTPRRGSGGSPPRRTPYRSGSLPPGRARW